MVARSEAQDDARSGGEASARPCKRARRTHVTRTLSTLRKRELVMFIQCSTDLLLCVAGQCPTSFLCTAPWRTGMARVILWPIIVSRAVEKAYFLLAGLRPAPR